MSSAKWRSFCLGLNVLTLDAEQLVYEFYSHVHVRSSFHLVLLCHGDSSAQFIHNCYTIGIIWKRSIFSPH